MFLVRFSLCLLNEITTFPIHKIKKIKLKNKKHIIELVLVYFMWLYKIINFTVYNRNYFLVGSIYDQVF